MPDPKNHFSNDADFDAFMRAIDAEMRAENIPITAREISGFIRASSRLKADLRLMPLPKRGPIAGVYAGDNLSLRILSWFQTKYGDRLKADFSPGMVPVLIEGDPYLMRLPRVFGHIRLVCDAATHSKPVGSLLGVKAPPVHNVLDSVQGLMPAVSAALSQRHLEALAYRFRSASESFSWMERVPEDELVDAAFADLAAATHAILGRTAHYGLSRWSSLQATEKFYKAFITSKAAPYKRTHELGRLDDAARGLGFQGLPPEALDLICCDAEVRYDGSRSTVLQAVNACQTSISACGLLAQSICLSRSPT